MNFSFPYIYIYIIIPTDELYHFSEGLKPPTRIILHGRYKHKPNQTILISNTDSNNEMICNMVVVFGCRWGFGTQEFRGKALNLAQNLAQHKLAYRHCIDLIFGLPCVSITNLMTIFCHWTIFNDWTYWNHRPALIDLTVFFIFKSSFLSKVLRRPEIWYLVVIHPTLQIWTHRLLGGPTSQISENNSYGTSSLRCGMKCGLHMDKPLTKWNAHPTSTSTMPKLAPTVRSQ